MNKCLLGIVFLICFYKTGVSAQSVDASLNRKLESLKTINGDDTGKVNLLRTIAWEYRTTNYKKAKIYFHEAEGLAEKIHDQSGLIDIYDKLGNICKLSGEYDSAIYFHLKCLKLREAANDKAGMAKDNLDLGLVYIYLNDSVKAGYYLRKALEISKKFNDISTGAKADNGLGYLYVGYQKYDLARSYYFKALNIFILLKNKEEQANIYNNIGGSYYYEGDNKKALSYFFLSVKIKQELNDEHALADMYDNIGVVYQKINMDSSLYYLNKGLILAKKTGAANTMMEIYGNLTAYYEKMDDYKSAYKNYRLYTALKDSIFNIDKQKAIDEMQTKYETEKKEQQIAILTSNKKLQGLLRNFLIIALALILVIALIMINRYRFERKVNKIIEAQKERADELLLNILPAETAEELKKYGKTSPKNYDEVSVLFADVKGFSILSQQMNSRALVEDLDKYFGAFDLICEKFGLEKIKTIGDAYLCAGGLPEPGKCNPKDVIDAALEMQQYVERVKQERMLKNEPYFEIRIGIHTGPVVAGVVGIKKFAYDIWGDTVNTAARMEQYGETGKVNISEQTYDKIKDCFICTLRGNIEVKNKGVFAMYFVEGVRHKE